MIETVWLCASDSWASVRQYGRRLWDEIESACGWWVNRGRPDFTRFGITVSEVEQRVWLDTQHRLVAKIDLRPG